MDSRKDIKAVKRIYLLVRSTGKVQVWVRKLLIKVPKIPFHFRLRLSPIFAANFKGYEKNLLRIYYAVIIIQHYHKSPGKRS